MFRSRPRNDDGTSLVIVLIIITVMAAVTGVVLSQIGTSFRVTQAVRDQGGVTYSADAAAQVAIGQLAKNNFNGVANSCQAASASLALPGFYPATNGLGTAGTQASSAFVKCTPDSNNASSGNAQGANTSPGSAILALATVASGEDGIYVNSTAPGGSNPVKVRGGVFSDSTINIAAGQFQNTWPLPSTTLTGKSYITARGNCSGTIMYDPTYITKTCNAPADAKGLDPGTLTPHGGSYDAPSASTSAATISTCTGSPAPKYQTITPGRLTSAAALNALTGCTNSIVWFQPGVYYFDFQDAGGASNRIWHIKNTYVVAGTPTTNSVLTSSPSASAWPNACIPPTPSGTVLGQGAEFVFGGNSQLWLEHQSNPGGQLTICASNTSAATGGGPPIAVYGLKQAVGPVSAQSGCVTTVASRCAMIYSDQSPNTTITIQGTTYAPNAWINLSLNNSTNQVFRWGLIIRSLSIGTTGSPNLANAVIDVPDDALIPIPVPTIYYLEVYVCPSSGTCDGSGTPKVRVKLQLSTDSPPVAKVLSWSVNN